MFFFPLRVITAVYFVFLFLDLFIIDIEIPYSTDKVSLDKQKKRRNVFHRFAEKG